MSMQTYVNAACEAQRRDPVGYADYFGPEDDDWVDEPVAAETATDNGVPPSERVAEVVGEAAGALADNFELSDLHASTVSSETHQAEIPLSWQEAVDGLEASERRVLGDALAVPVHNLGITTVGIVRRLTEAELLKAKGIGPARASVLKALGHHADQETELALVVDEDRHAQAFKAGRV